MLVHERGYITPVKKSQRRVFHVTHLPAGGWQVKEQGADEAVSIHATKDQAVKAASAIARENKPSQVMVHLENGRFEHEFTYGGDPYPPLG